MQAFRLSTSHKNPHKMRQIRRTFAYGRRANMLSLQPRHIERLPPEQKVGGSTPLGRTKYPPPTCKIAADLPPGRTYTECGYSEELADRCIAFRIWAAEVRRARAPFRGLACSQSLA